jgi:hypothetical protein
VKAFLKGKEGSVPGNLFKAELKLVPVKRLDQKALKEAEPELVKEYSPEVTDKRVSFTVR